MKIKSDQGYSESQHELYVAIWSKAVDTQMHFNEMSVKSRQLGLTFVAAALGVAIVLLSEGKGFALSFQVFGKDIQLHVSVFLILGACFALYAVKTLDLNVYHRMLRGAVTFGEDFEELYIKKFIFVEKGMTQSISHFSRFDDAAVTRDSKRRYVYSGQCRRSAEQKIRAFYAITMTFLLIGALAIFCLQNNLIIG